MIELDLTRHNPLVDPALHVWGWEIPIYLFLGGWVAGMMIVTGYFLLRPERTGVTRRGAASSVCSTLPALGLVLLSLGMLALFLDLEHKFYVWRLYTAFRPASPMSWGAWILVLVYPALAASLAVKPHDWLSRRWAWFARPETFFRARPRLVRVVAAVNITLGVMLGVYTGILLSGLGARPLWNSPMLGLLFLASGLSTAAAFVNLVASDDEERRVLERADLLFLAIELALLALFLVGLLTGGASHVQAATLFFGGPFTAVFWVFVVGLGLVIPLVLQMLAGAGRAPHTAVAPLLVMAGGVALRFVMVYAGQVSHWI